MKFLLTGGGKCKYCKSERTTKAGCPWNPDSIRKKNINAKKHPNAKGVPTGFAETELKKAGLWDNFKKASASSSNSSESSLSAPKPVAPKPKSSSPKSAAKPVAPKPKGPSPKSAAKPVAKPTPNNKCTPEKDKICEEKNKICNPKSGRCNVIKTKSNPKLPSPKPNPKPNPKPKPKPNPKPKSKPNPKPKPKPKPNPKSKPKAPSPKPIPKKVKNPEPASNPTKKSTETDSDSDLEDIIPVNPAEVEPEVVPETRSIAVIYIEDIGTVLERVRLLRNGVQKIYKLGLAYKGGNVQYRNLYKDDGELSIEGRCIITEPNKMDIQWTI
jgi:hypothetical protein